MNPQAVYDYDEAKWEIMLRFRSRKDGGALAAIWGRGLDDIFFDFRDARAWRILRRWRG